MSLSPSEVVKCVSFLLVYWAIDLSMVTEDLATATCENLFSFLLVVCDDLQQFVWIVHQVLILSIHEPVIKFNELVQDEGRDVEIAPGIDRHVQKYSLNLAQDLMNALGCVLEEPGADVDLICIEQGLYWAVHRSPLVPLVDDLHANADSLKAFVNFAQIFENLKSENIEQKPSR